METGFLLADMVELSYWSHDSGATFEMAFYIDGTLDNL